MKKVFFLLLTLLITPACFALPLGNPAEPTLYPVGIFCGSSVDPCTCFSARVRLGYSGDFVYNRHLSVKRPPLSGGKVLRRTHINTNAAYLALNLNNMVDIFSTLGASRLEVHANQMVWGNANPFNGILTTNTQFSWSVGVRSLLLNWHNFTIGIEGQYFQFNPYISSYWSAKTGNTNYFNEGNRTRYNEWQVGVGLAYTIQSCQPGFGLTPYIGFKGNRANFETHNFSFITNDGEPITIFPTDSHKNWGFAAGATLTFCDCVGFTAEGRWGDEKALFINGQICF